MYHPPVSFSSYFFLLLCEDRKRKAKGNCFCIVDVPLRILKLKSWAERIFFRLRAATLTKEYQMKVGWKTATKSPTGTRTSLCNINSHFLPTSQFKASFVAIACITQLYHTLSYLTSKWRRLKGVKYSGLITQKTHCIVKRNNERNEGLSFLCKNGKNTIIRFLRLCTRIECTM